MSSEPFQNHLRALKCESSENFTYVWNSFLSADGQSNLHGISKFTNEIPHKIPFPHAERYDFYSVEISRVLRFKSSMGFWRTITIFFCVGLPSVCGVRTCSLGTISCQMSCPLALVAQLLCGGNTEHTSQGAVSLTFRGAQKYSRKNTQHQKSHLWWEFQSENLYVCPKQGFGHTYKVSDWNSHHKYYLCNT